MRARLAASLVILAALAGLPSLWVFSAAAILVISWLRIADRGTVVARSCDPAIGTLIALTLYAASLAIALLTARVALGRLELPMLPFEQTGIAPHLARGSLGFYDKSELRLALLELLVLWVLWAAVLAEMWGSLARRRADPPAVHPLGAVFILVLYFAAIELPPYSISAADWQPLLSAGGGGFTAHHGPLKQVVFAAWAGCFGTSSLSLGVAQMIALWIAGLAMYALVRTLTASRSMALLTAGWLVLASTAHSAPETALVGLLSYFALRDAPYRRWGALLVGLVALWNPLVGIAGAGGLLLVLCYRLAASAPQSKHALLALVSGLAISGIALVVAPTAGASWHVVAAPSMLMVCAGAFLYFGFVLRRVARRRRLSARQLWLGGNLIFALALASFSTDPAWAFAPGIALVAHFAIRMLSLYFHRASGLRTAAARGFVPAVLCLLFNFVFPVDRLNERIESHVTRYEPTREAWYRQCAGDGGCDHAGKPSLAASLRAASQ